jgi:tetratricopeptide (TPR) repeat protein
VCLVCVPAWGSGLDDIRRSQQLRRAGDYKGAEQVLRDTLNGPIDAKTRITALNDLADLLREQDRRAESRTLFTEALNTPEPTWPQKFSAMLGLADLDRQELNWPSSIDRLNRAADLARTNHDLVLEAFAQRSLGETWLDAGNTSRAEPLLKKALAVMEADNSVPRERVAVALDSMASLYRAEDKTSLAEEAYLRELDIQRAVLGEYHPQTAMVKGRLAELWSEQGDYDKAESWSRQTLDLMKGKFGEHSVAAGSAMVNLGVIEQRANHLDTAADMYSHALSIYRDASVDPDVARLIAQLYADVLSRQHKGREAKQVIASFHLK